MTQTGLVSLKASRKTLSRIPQGDRCAWSSYGGHSLSAGVRRSTRQEECLSEETLLHLFLWGNGEAKPLPAHMVTGAKRIKKKNKKKLTTNQQLISQNNRLVTHQCPQDATTNSAIEQIQRTNWDLRTPRRLVVLGVQWRHTKTLQVLKTQAQPESSLATTP